QDTRAPGRLISHASSAETDDSVLKLQFSLILDLQIASLRSTKLEFIAHHVGLGNAIAKREVQLNSDLISWVAAIDQLAEHGAIISEERGIHWIGRALTFRRLIERVGLPGEAAVL